MLNCAFWNFVARGVWWQNQLSPQYCWFLILILEFLKSLYNIGLFPTRTKFRTVHCPDPTCSDLLFAVDSQGVLDLARNTSQAIVQLAGVSACIATETWTHLWKNWSEQAHASSFPQEM